VGVHRGRGVSRRSDIRLSLSLEQFGTVERFILGGSVERRKAILAVFPERRLYVGLQVAYLGNDVARGPNLYRVAFRLARNAETQDSVSVRHPQVYPREGPLREGDRGLRHTCVSSLRQPGSQRRGAHR